MSLGFYEGIVILVFLVIASIMAGFVWLGSRSIRKALKACPHCAERIKPAAKICRYCQRDVASVEIEYKAPRGLFSD
jgi:predicted amidophosphoribosyltransferase